VEPTLEGDEARPPGDPARQLQRRLDRLCARVEEHDGVQRVGQRGGEGVADAAGPDATAVAVVHGGIIAEICRLATNSDPFAFLYVDNGSITRVMRLPSGRWALRGFCDVSHLNGR
jgi:probable phosphoglycerate mutase